MNSSEQELIYRINDLKNIIATTKSWKCRNDHIKALKKAEQALNYYRKHYYKGEAK